MSRVRNAVRFAVLAAAVLGSIASVPPEMASADTQIGQTISVTSGNAQTSFSLGVTSLNNVCQGNTALDGYQWGMYIASSAVDLNAITVAGGALTAPSGYVSTLFSVVGEDPQVDKNTSTIGQITGTTNVKLDVSGIPSAGTYRIGYYCSQAGQETRHWITPITVRDYISPTNFTWAFGLFPPTPVLTAVQAFGSITGTVTAVTGTPAVTGYTVTATPVGGGAPLSATVPAAGPYSYSISGLTNGTSYNVVVTATNVVGSTTSPALTVTPCICGVMPAPVVSVASGPPPVTVSWAMTTGMPFSGATLVNHVVTFTSVGSSAPIAPITVPAPATSTNAPGARCGDSYTISVVGTYSNGQQTAPGIGAFSLICAEIQIQDITVVRPQGALVLTQRCGVHGSAPAYTNSAFGPTFPALPATAGADPVGTEPPAAVGTAPIADDAPSNANSFGTNPVGPVGNTTAAGQPDTLFGQYPHPVDASGNAIATYATNCAVNLGTASLITSGPNAGAYFRATGRIAQLTVVDTRDTDAGWTLNGRMGTFSNGTDSFSGNLLGWVPEVTWDSNPNLDNYNTTATAGNTRLPQASASTTGLGAAFNSTNTDLANSLSKANAGAGLGMAVMDARLNLLIPVTADSGTYKGVLTFTII